MTAENIDSLTSIDSTSVDSVEVSKRRRGCLIAFAITLILFFVVLFLVRPGVFTIQPIGAIPEGITVIYHSRNPQMPFFSSPDGLCLEIQGSVSLMCRLAAMGAVDEIADRIIIRLPYIDMAYLLSTDGTTFDR